MSIEFKKRRAELLFLGWLLFAMSNLAAADVIEVTLNLTNNLTLVPVTLTETYDTNESYTFTSTNVATWHLLAASYSINNGPTETLYDPIASLNNYGYPGNGPGWGFGFVAGLSPSGTLANGYIGGYFQLGFSYASGYPGYVLPGTFPTDYYFSYAQRYSASDYISEGYTIQSIAYGAQSSAVPEPASLLLLGTGLAGFAGTLKRKLHR
jgi:hypothetical protein